MKNTDPYGIRKQLSIKGEELDYFSLDELQKKGHDIRSLPFSIRILLENALRNYDGFAITDENLKTLLEWKPEGSDRDIPYKPARVLMQDFTGVPAVVDIASLRAEVDRKGKDPEKMNPQIPVDLVVDHSVQVDYFGIKDAYQRNVETEYQRNGERYKFLKWAQKAFDNFRVVPPGMGICHQVNLEYLASGVIKRDGQIFPDTLVGTDSHTPMVNGIGVVGWGVGGIEAEAALLGQPIYFITPQVIGLKLTGKLPAGSTATDMVLTVTELLRSYGVVGKFVEVFGSGLDNLTVPDRATISNMSPEFGCTITYFPIDRQTLDYMRRTNRPEDQIEMVEKYCRANMLWREDEEKIRYSHVLELDLSTVEPTVSGPKRPQDKILLSNFKPAFIELLDHAHERKYIRPEARQINRWEGEGGDQPIQGSREAAATGNDMRTVEINNGNEKYRLSDGSVVIAAITSCTNTSNPSVMLGAGLIARKAVEKGLNVKPWVKTSLAPGSKVVTDYLENSGLMTDLEALKFHLVGYGCTSCIGNSGPLPEPIAKAVEEHDLIVASALSGNRNFEARVHPQVKMNFLMSPMLVVIYALAGRVDIDLKTEPLGEDKNGNPVFMKDLWPDDQEIQDVMEQVLTPADFAKNYGEIFDGNEIWRNMEVTGGKLYEWDEKSTYVREAPFFKDLPAQPRPLKDIGQARVLLYLGDSVTTDHISPAGSFRDNTPAGKYLVSQGVEPRHFNSYGSRRGNDNVMVRGTFANVRIKNKLAEKEGGFTTYLPENEEMAVFDAARKYRESGTPLVVLAGKEYGSGSSRDWAAKGTYLLGIKAVIAESYERIHRSNLIGMGVLPLQFEEGESAQTIGLSGKEIFTIAGINDHMQPMQKLNVTATDPDTGEKKNFKVVSRLDSGIEIAYYRNGGILQYVLRQFLNRN